MTEEEKKGGEKIKMLLMATNVTASRLPERQPTGTPIARANRNLFSQTMVLGEQIIRTNIM